LDASSEVRRNCRRRKPALTLHRAEISVTPERQPLGLDAFNGCRGQKLSLQAVAKFASESEAAFDLDPGGNVPYEAYEP
jgi:hypothetical protein